MDFQKPTKIQKKSRNHKKTHVMKMLTTRYMLGKVVTLYCTTIQFSVVQQNTVQYCSTVILQYSRDVMGNMRVGPRVHCIEQYCAIFY